MITLHLGDCLELMGSIPDGSIDLVLADLPYGTTACKWDTVIPFEPLWAHYERLLKPRGAVVLTASQPFTTTLINSNSVWFKYTLVLPKQRVTGFINAPYQPLRGHEDVVVFSPAASTHSMRGTMVYNPQMGEGKPYSDSRTKRKQHGFEMHAWPSERHTVKDKVDRFPRSILPTFPQDQGLHPTQKPVALMEYFVRTYSNEGETVLDNAMGSGTTGVACLNTGRRFVGIELDPDYFAVASKRIEATRFENTHPLLASL